MKQLPVRLKALNIVAVIVMVAVGTYHMLTPLPSNDGAAALTGVVRVLILLGVWASGFANGMTAGYRRGRDIFVAAWEPILRDMHKALTGTDPGPLMSGKEVPKNETWN